LDGAVLEAALASRLLEWRHLNFAAFNFALLVKIESNTTHDITQYRLLVLGESAYSSGRRRRGR